jgi:hypothetical protein
LGLIENGVLASFIDDKVYAVLSPLGGSGDSDFLSEWSMEGNDFPTPVFPFLRHGNPPPLAGDMGSRSFLCWLEYGFVTSFIDDKVYAVLSPLGGSGDSDFSSEWSREGNDFPTPVFPFLRHGNPPPPAGDMGSRSFLCWLEYGFIG